MVINTNIYLSHYEHTQLIIFSLLISYSLFKIKHHRQIVIRYQSFYKMIDVKLVISSIRKYNKL